MIDMGSIQAAIGSLKAAGDIAKGMVDLKTAAEIQSKVIELQREILSAQSSALFAQSEQLVLLQTKRDLEEKMAQMEGWKDEKERYQLAEYGRGCLAYALKPSMEQGEPFHCLCAQCYQRGKKSILQIVRWEIGTRPVMQCFDCGAKQTFEKQPSPI